jgi:sensor histidine kinase YesM
VLLNTLASDWTYRVQLSYGREADFYAIWINQIPWWGNWAIATPLIIAGVKTIFAQQQSILLVVLKNALLMLCAMLCYFILTLLEVTLIDNKGFFDMEIFVSSVVRLSNSPIHLDFLMYMGILSLGTTMSYYDKVRNQAIHNQQLVNQLLEVELQSLKSQLSPHFLFNCLNTISGLVRLEQKNTAVKALKELSQLFRKVLESQNKQHSTLRDEMEFIDGYLMIQKLRFENKLRVEIDISRDCMNVELPFMLLHTLVENAVQQDSQLESDQNLLRLVVTKSTQRLSIFLVNRVAKGEEYEGFTVGLNNCRKRLEHIYQADYKLSCKETFDSHFETLLTIPIGDMHA